MILKGLLAFSYSIYENTFKIVRMIFSRGKEKSCVLFLPFFMVSLSIILRSGTKMKIKINKKNNEKNFEEGFKEFINYCKVKNLAKIKLDFMLGI